MEITVHKVARMCGGHVADLTPLIESVREGGAYRRVNFRERGGKERNIVVPYLYYKLVLRALASNLGAELNYTAPQHVHGFVRGRSTLTNAACHLDRNCVLRVDLESFFPSISSEMVVKYLTRFGCNQEAAEMIGGLATIDGGLAIGLNTSPLLSNLVFKDVDDQLAEYAKNNALVFTRFVDDLVFSGDSIEDRHRDELYEILFTRGWAVNKSKTAFMRRGKAQYVTGLYVGCSDRPRIPRHIKKQLRATSYLIENFGYVEYMSKFDGKERWGSARRLVGWARYISSIEPEFGKPLLVRFDRLIGDPEVEEYDRRSDCDGYI